MTGLETDPRWTTGQRMRAERAWISSEEPRLSADYHPRGEGAKAAQREEEKARLQGRRASQATEAATQTTASQPVSHERQIPR
ncbi:hypothetical protein AAFF_G00118870 [Aldrovandia affinis]|uniref:Uncharacterized protein n=1 Tax=Aldrovandia affinis TaxID=143900 RepID=A0AAD7RSM9_9TELE|nr:hypothetical protein AAFF_G00118870 [Aldrovandia affinis]